MTLEEIAGLAGVSRATVSRVVNQQPRVRPATRERVERIIHEQGYQPNLAARMLASRRSRVIGFALPSMLSNLTSPYYALIMQGVTAACDEHDFSLMFCPIDPTRRSSYERYIHSGFIDGLVVSTASVGHDFLVWLHEQQFPFVLMGRDSMLPAINTVSADYEGGAAMAAQHLLWLGYDRIAIIAGLPTHGGAVARRDAFLQALAIAGAPCPDDYIVQTDFSEHGGRQAMSRLLSLERRPRAVFCCSDLAAIGAIGALRDAGLKVPGDVAIIGFDDIPMAASYQPALTTVRQPIRQIGFAATTVLVDILESMWSDPHRVIEPHHVLLPTELIVRDSCGQKQLYRTRRARVSVERA